MSTLFLIAVVAFVGIFIAVPLFEFVAAALLLTPLLKFLLAYVLMQTGFEVGGKGTEQAFYIFSFVLLSFSAHQIFGSRGKENRLTITDWAPLGAFSLIFTLAYVLCMQWSEFYAMGERMRDYALIASAFNSPVVPQEPWMEGYGLNYYVFWYRFAAMLGAVLHMQVWDAYHAIVAFALALYGAAIFQLVRVVLDGGRTLAWCAAVGVPFIPNVAGMLTLKHLRGEGFSQDGGWWGPSRVIVGSITEFPAWSFLLGDAHPHYLNLATFSLLLLFFYRIVTHGSSSIGSRFYHGVFMVLAGAFFLVGSNAWEVPMWGGMAFLVIALGILLNKSWLSQLQTRYSSVLDSDGIEGVWDFIRQVLAIIIVIATAIVLIRYHRELNWFSIVFISLVSLVFAYLTCPFRLVKTGFLSLVRQKKHVLVLTTFWILLLVTLRLSSQHIKPEGGGELTFVRGDIPVTTTLEIFVHWGWQLVLLAVGSIAIRRWSLETALMSVFLVCTALFDKGALFIYALIGIQLVRIVELRADEVSWRDVFGEALVIGSLGLILLPEIVFLNDSYGGDNERMNTIFKIYTTSWALLCLAVVYIWRRVLKVRLQSANLVIRGVTNLSLWLVALIILGGSVNFYRHTLPKRLVTSDARYKYDGLSDVETKFPGSAAIIRGLREQEYGRVLEAQGRPYSSTTFVSTLAGQPAYLGWANHVGLLTRERGEISRREKITKEIYTHTDCLQRQQIALKENIAYIVVGSLEKQKFSDVLNADFSCMRKVRQDKQYSLYRVK
jgi:uncharacterized membrane protein